MKGRLNLRETVACTSYEVLTRTVIQVCWPSICIVRIGFYFWR